MQHLIMNTEWKQEYKFPITEGSWVFTYGNFSFKGKLNKNKTYSKEELCKLYIMKHDELKLIYPNIKFNGYYLI